MMSRNFRLVAIVLVLVSLLFASISESKKLKTQQKYLPNWDSLDSRPLPQWYDDAKVGIFIHWGVFSVPSFRSEWFWWYWQGSQEPDVVDFMAKNYPKNFQYADFGPMFTAEFYDPDYWAKLFQASGAKYIVITSKHHEGFCNWPTKVSFNWNSYENGPKRDLVGDLRNSIRNLTDLRFGIYHSLFEWFNPVHLQDARNNYTTQDFVRSKSMPELYELINNYQPDVLWSDGDSGPDSYWNSTEFLAWLYNESPVKDQIVTNDRWGNNGVACHHGGFYTCDDRYNPGKKQNHKWENCMTIDKYSWGYRRNAKLEDFLTIDELIATMAETVSCGGNILINVGPTKEGTIAPIFEERLKQLGEWLNINGEAIYKTQPWIIQNDTVNPDVWYTAKGSDVYAIVNNALGPGEDLDTIVLGAAVNMTSTSQISLLGYNATPIRAVMTPHYLSIQVSSIVVSQVKSKWSWVFKFANAAI